MIEKAIHEIIASSDTDAIALRALLAADRIVTGINHNRDLPYASISVEGNTPLYRSNVGGMRNYRVRFSLWHENHLLGQTIAEAIQDLFENKSFDTTTERIACIRHDNTLSLQEEDGTWQFTIDFQIQSARKVGGGGGQGPGGGGQ